MLVQSNTGVPCVTNVNNAAELLTCDGDASQNVTMEADGTIQVNGACLDTAGGGTTAGTLLVLDPCTGASTQVWTQGAANPGSAGNSLMNQGAAGMCLDDPGSVTVPGTQLQISVCENGLAAENWVLPRT